MQYYITLLLNLPPCSTTYLNKIQFIYRVVTEPTIMELTKQQPENESTLCIMCELMKNTLIGLFKLCFISIVGQFEGYKSILDNR